MKLTRRGFLQSMLAAATMPLAPAFVRAESLMVMAPRSRLIVPSLLRVPLQWVSMEAIAPELIETTSFADTTKRYATGILPTHCRTEFEVPHDVGLERLWINGREVHLRDCWRKVDWSHERIRLSLELPIEDVSGGAMGIPEVMGEVVR